MTSFVILLAIIVALILYVIGIYNSLVNLRNRVKNAFAQIDVQLTRRYDLIPNLIEAVKGYMKHERETLDAVISARNAAISNLEAARADPSNADAIKKLGATEGLLDGALGHLFALSEAYPDLKASQNFLELQSELANTENRIQASLRFFNGNIRENNNKVQQFPSNIVAGMFGFSTREFFELDVPEAREAVTVEF